MKIFTIVTMVLVTGFSINTSASAQETAVRLPGETALEMANRINPCGELGIEAARFTGAGNTLRVRCAGIEGMAGGLGAGAATGALALIAIAAFASDGDSSTGTTSTSTTGTN